MFNPPTMAQWRRLYELADAIDALEPWTFLQEEDLFGVRDPVTGQDGFVSVMGSFGEHFAVAVYLGAEALANFWEMHDEGSSVDTGLLLQTRQVQLSFEDRDVLEKEELAIIKQIGAKYRGKQAWPAFRSYVPGYLPWRIQADEANVLIYALEQTLDVAARAAENSELLAPPDDSDVYFFRVPSVQDGVITWSDQMVEVLPPEDKSFDVALDPAVAQRVQKLPKRKGSIEVGLTLMPQALTDDDGRPYLPTTVLVVESQFGMILSNEVLPPQVGMMETFLQIPSVLLTQVEQWGYRPSTVAVSEPMIAEFLEVLKPVLGWNVRVQSKLPKLEAASQAIYRSLGLGELMDAINEDLDDGDEELVALLASLLGDERSAEEEAVRHRGPAADKAKPAAKKPSAKKKASPPKQVFQLKITLRESKPPIWRRVLAPDNLTLLELHHVIQVAMGWFDAHLHEFRINDVDYGQPNYDYGAHVADENAFRLSDVITPGTKRFHYTYDFGDTWGHTIAVEKVLPYEAGGVYPICLDGKRACPPEDIGGIWGYANFLETISDPSDPEHEGMLEWIGGEFDPEAFDIDEVNQVFEQMRRK